MNSSAFAQVTAMDTLHRAWLKVSSKDGRPGIDGIDLNLYGSDLRNNLRMLQNAVVCG